MVVVGGDNDSESTEVYDIAGDSWTYGPNLPGGIFFSTVVSSDTRLFVTGGISKKNGQTFGTIYEYFEDSWVLVSDKINPPRSHHVAMFLPE